MYQFKDSFCTLPQKYFIFLYNFIFRKEVKRRDEKNKISFLKHEDFVVCFKALIGTIANSCGLMAASMFLRNFKLIDHVSACISDDPGKAKFAHNLYSEFEIKQTPKTHHTLRIQQIIQS